MTTEPTLAAGGDALAHAPDGRVVFVAGAAPSERVEVTVERDNARFLRARMTKVLSPSPHRVTPTCAHFEACGGCTLQHVAYSAQVESKLTILQDSLQRIGGVTVVPEAPWTGAPYGYRSRARLARDFRGRLGYREEKSHEVVEVDRCPVLRSELQEVLTALRAARTKPERPDRRQERSAKKIDDLHLIGGVGCVALAIDGGHKRLVSAAARASGVRVDTSPDALIEADDGHGLQALSPRVFAQANFDGNAALVTQVAEWAGPQDQACIVELYAGSGNFTRALVNKAQSVLACESHREAVALGRRTVPQAQFVIRDVADALVAWQAEGVTAQTVVLDPPRAGAPPEVLDGIASLSPERIVYVSCDAATFSRDVRRLVERGFRLQQVRMFDLYPQTAHLEVVGQLVRE